MATGVREINLGDTFDQKFTTIDSTGLPVTLAGSPAVAAYPGNSTTEVTAGITLSVDFDTRTGLHNVRVVASSGNGYAADTDYTLVLTAGTVDSVSVVGYVIGHFRTKTIALQPTTAGRTLGVDANDRIDVGSWLGTAVTLGNGAPDVNIQSTDDIDLSATQKASVNAEVDTALVTTTYAEPGQETPAATASLKDKIGYIYKFLRNRVTSTSTTISVYNDDATTVDHKSTHSDDGATYDRGEFTTGP